MSAYSYVLDAQGRNRPDVLKRDDGVLCSLVTNDPDGQAAQAWMAAGGVPAPAVPRVTGRQINGQARAAGVTGALNTVLTSTTSTAKPDDIRYFNSVGLDTAMPVDNPKAARVLGLAGVRDVPGFMAAALLLPA